MKTKNANKLLLLFTLFGGICQMALSFVNDTVLSNYSIDEILKYIVFIIIGIIFIKKDEGNILDVLPYNVPIKPKTAALIVVSVVLFAPLSNILSWIGSSLFGNLLQYAEQSPMFDPSDGFRIVFVVGIIPAVFEELYFRGFFFKPYRDAKGPRFAILLSAFLFGIFHLNFQQAIYAIVIGIIIGVLRELTGSMWAGTLYHFVNNGWSAFLLYLCNKSENVKEITSHMPINRMSFDSTGQILYSFALAAVYTTLGLICLRKIAQIEGKEETYLEFFKSEKCNNDKVWTPSLIIAVAVDLIIMIGTTVLLSFDILSAPLLS